MNLKIFQIRSLKARTTLFTLVIFVISIWSLAFYAGRVLHQEFEIQHSQQQFSTVSVLAEQVNQELGLRLSSLETVAESINSTLIGNPHDLQLVLEQRPVFQSLFNGGSFVTRLDGMAIASLPVAVGRVGVNFMERDHVASVLKQGKSRISKPLIGKLLNSPVVSMAVPIRDSQGKVIGALVGVTDLGKPNFLSHITDSFYGKSGGYFITAKPYRLIVSAFDKSRVMETLPAPGISLVLDRFIQGYEGSEIFVNPRGVEVLAAAKGIPVADWYLAAEVPAAEVFAPIRIMQQRILLATLLLTFLAGSLTWWILHRQLLPLFETVQLLASIESSDQTPQALPITRQDEIGELIGSFNHLLEKLANRDGSILTLTQMYAALSHCNQAIVRCTNEVELFAELCRDVVQFGGMKMAWIGMLDEARKRVRPVASFGDGIAYLNGIEISVNASEPAGRGPTGTSMRENRPFWCQDFQHDPATSAWHERGMRFGWGSSASVPLLRQGVVVGAFTLYAGKVHAFDAAMQNLLQEMAEDVSFALDNFDREFKRRQAEEELRQSEGRFRAIIENTPIPLALNDEQGNITYLNNAFVRTVGYTRDVIPNLAEWFPRAYPNPDYRQWVEETWRQHLDDAKLGGVRFVPMELDIKCGSGEVRTFLVSAADLEGSYAGNHLVILYDITARKQAEEAVNKLSQAVEQSPNSIVITDLAANIEYANAAFTKFTGYRLDEVIGKNPRIMQSGRTSGATYDDMWAHLTRGDSWQGELFNRRKDGSEYIEWAKISPVRQTSGQITHYLAIKEDLTEKKAVDERINRLAHFDQLTGLPNRALLQDHFKFALSLAQRSGENLTVMFLDLDYFKDINDTLGHSIGDQLLMEIGKRIKDALREEDTVSRQGGDEFILILPGTDADGAALVASKLMEVISQPSRFAQHELIITASIGIAIYPHDGNDLETLSKNADTAMYRVKQDMRNDFRFFAQEMQVNSARTLQLSNALRHALARNELTLHYQPQLSIQDGHVVGAEALLRWQHPELGMISPTEFIPIAEGNGQIIPIGEWVLRTATQQLKVWLDSGLPPMVVAVNLSAVQFRQANIVELITRIIDEAQLPHESLEVELTEAVAMDDPQSAIDVMDSLHALGIRMSIDDFGTGYSSLSYLKKFKVYKLKIDQSFVHNLSEDPEDKAIVSAIINLATSLGLHTIAEGVETAGQLAFLRMRGCDEVQGYYFSKPLPADQFEKFVINSIVLPSIV